jgi:hypothetical protein
MTDKPFYFIASVLFFALAMFCQIAPLNVWFAIIWQTLFLIMAWTSFLKGI